MNGNILEKSWPDGLTVESLGALITGPSGRIQVPEDLRLHLAIFEAGVAYITPEKRWDPRVRSIISLARSQSVEVRHYREVSTDEIVLLYRDKTIAEREAPDIERQKEIAEIISRAVEMGASDIHIRVLRDYTEIRVRVHGRLRDMMTKQASEGMPLIKAMFAVASDTDGPESELSFQQGALTWKSKLLPPKLDMVRLQYTPESEGRGSVIMRLKPKAKASETSIETLGYNAQQMHDIAIMRKRTNGLYLLSGKVSSGKTTTLQRILNTMSQEKSREISIFAIEEPKELELANAIQHPARQLADGTDGFLLGMKAALRSDPNVIVLGEIRSKMLADLAINAVMTGHALWSTIHAGSALGILDRLSDYGVDSWKLQDPSVVRGLTYQRLCGVICPHCKISFERAVDEGRLERKLAIDLSEMFGRPMSELYVRGDGCEKCSGLGLVGRTVVAETCLTDPHLLDLFREGKRMEMRKYWSTDQQAGGMGGIPVMYHALTKVGVGVCDILEVEEEVDLVSSFMRDYPHLMPKMAEDVRAQLQRGFM